MNITSSFLSAFLLRVCYLASASILPALNTTGNLILQTDDSTFIPSNINATALLNSGYHYNIPNTQLSLHLTLLPTPLPLNPEITHKCLHSFAEQLTLHPKTAHLDRLLSSTFGIVQALFAPVKAPLSNITFGDMWRVIVALWVFMNREKLLFEMKYAVFGNGRMVAWGSLGVVDGPGPGPSPMTISVGRPTGVVERGV